MSLLGFDSTGTATLNGLNNMNCTNLYSDDTYINNSTNPLNVGDELLRLQAEIDTIDSQLIGITQGNYFLAASSNNPSNTLSEKKLYFNQLIASNQFTLLGTGTSATQIQADASGVYNIWYKINYQKIDATTSYEVRTWIMKNGVDVDYTTTIQTMSTQSQWMTITNQYTLTLNKNDYVEIVWLSSNAAASSDILDFIGATSPYPQVSSQSVIVSQIMNTGQGKSDTISVGTTTTLAAGSSAYVTDTTTTYPTYTNHQLNFGIPKGDQGNVGPQGPQGPTGPQGPKGDQGDTNATATAALATAIAAEATAIAAGAAAASAISANAAQDITIGGLGTALNAVADRVVILEVKTTDQSWGALTGTTFSRKVHITNTGAKVGSDAVYLGSSEASTFLYGLTADDPIISTNGTSQFDNLVVNDSAEITNNLFVTGTTYLDRSTLASAKKVVLYDNGTGDDYDYMGLWNNNSGATKYFNFENFDGGAYQYYFGNGLGSARTLAKSLSLDEEISYTAAATFLKSAGASQQIQLVRDTANNKVRIDLLGDTAGANQYDGQIIQEQGNGIDDNRGTMMIQSGGLEISALNAGILMSANLSTTISTGSDLAITSTGNTQINCDTLDINITSASNPSTIDCNGPLTITGTDNLTIATGSVGFDFNINAAQDLNLNSDGIMKLTTTLNKIELDTTAATSNGTIHLNSGERVDLDAVANIELTSAADIIASATDIDLSTTTGLIRLTSTTETEVNCSTFDLNSTGIVTIDSTGDAINLTSYGETQIDCGSLDINSSGVANIDATSNINITSTTGNITIDTPTLLSSINIGNATSIVYINGAVFMPNAINFSMIGSFFEQF